MTESPAAPPAPAALLTLADFEAAKFLEILAKHPEARLFVLFRAFSDAAESAQAEGQDGAARALVLLARICYMMLQPADKISPFGPVQNFADGSSAPAPNHFTNADIDVLAQLADRIGHTELRARVADLVWLRAKRHGRRMVDLAIDAYLALPIARESWLTQGLPRWHRALQLTLSVGDRARVKAIVDALAGAFRAAGDSLAHPALAYLRPLEAESLTRDHAKDVAEQLARAGAARMTDKRYEDAEAPLDRAAAWFKWAGPKFADRLADVQVQRGMAIEAHADAHGTAIVRQALYIDAIRHLREVNGVFREVLAVDDTIARVRKKLGEGGRLALTEMKTVRTASADVGELTRAAVAAVKDKSPIEALLALCGIDDFPKKDDYLAEAKAKLASSPLLAILGTGTLAGDGRVVATSPNGPELPDKAAELYRQHAGMVAVAEISPTLDQINLEHAITLEDFQAIARQCPVVPIGREATIGSGLYAGYRRDMVTAMHILMPQFEQLVRVQLKGAGCLTTTHDASGTDMEVGLSTLIERPEMVNVFGEDLKFAIHALMCDQTGPNLRNDVAHGLADDERMQSALGLYTWWLVLRIVVEQWWHARGRPTAAAAADTAGVADAGGEGA